MAVKIITLQFGLVHNGGHKDTTWPTEAQLEAKQEQLKQEAR